LQFLKAVGHIYDRIIQYLGVFSAILIGYVLAIMSLDVIMRFFFNHPLVWQSDVTIYIMVYITFFGTAWVLHNGGHVSIDMLVTRVNPGARAVLAIFSSFIGILTTLALTWYGIIASVDHFRAGSFYFAQIYIPKYLILSVIPLGSLLLLVQFIRNTYNGLLNLRTITKSKPVSAPPLKSQA
jgi:C4-dicarboxylate transporter, DctQ subunit